jgi:hypothetical protein
MPKGWIYFRCLKISISNCFLVVSPIQLQTHCPCWIECSRIVCLIAFQVHLITLWLLNQIIRDRWKWTCWCCWTYWNKSNRSCEKSWMFLKTRECDFPWIESILGDDGLVSQVQCTICNKIEGKAKMLVPSLTNFKSMPIIEK